MSVKSDNINQMRVILFCQLDKLTLKELLKRKHDDKENRR